MNFEIQPTIGGVETGITVFMGQTEQGPESKPYPIYNFDEFQEKYGDLNPQFPLSYAVSDFFANGGAYAIIIRLIPSTASDAVGGVGKGVRRLTRALLASPQSSLSLNDYVGYSANQPELRFPDGLFFNMLCLPPDTLNGTLPDGVLTLAARLCQERNALLIIDSPKDWEAYQPTDLSNWLNVNMGSDQFAIEGQMQSYAAVYYPRLRREEIPGIDPDQTWVPCGAIAGMLAREGSKNGVWHAPAGLEAKIFGFRTLPIILRDDTIETLNILHVNCLRMVRDDLIVWGAKTISLVPDLQYVSTRRLLNYIEVCVQSFLQSLCFSPNDANTWTTARKGVENFLISLWREGALAGSTPEEAFSVNCGLGDTMTGSDILNGTLILSVTIALIKPAEFIVLTIKTQMGA